MGRTAIVGALAVHPAVPNYRVSLRYQQRKCRPVIMMDTRRDHNPCRILVQLVVHLENGKI